MLRSLEQVPGTVLRPGAVDRSALGDHRPAAAAARRCALVPAHDSLLAGEQRRSLWRGGRDVSSSADIVLELNRCVLGAGSKLVET